MNKQIKDFMHTLARAPENRNVRFVRVDVGQLQEAARRNGIMKVPTFACFRHGVRLETATISNTTSALLEMLERHRSKEAPSRRRLPAFLAFVTSVAISAFAASRFTSRSAVAATDAASSTCVSSSVTQLPLQVCSLNRSPSLLCTIAAKSSATMTATLVAQSNLWLSSPTNRVMNNLAVLDGSLLRHRA
jgi:hypothetical protein